MCDAAQMPHEIDTWWDHLVDALGTVGEVTQRDPHGLRVVLGRDDTSKVVEIVMTQDEWVDLVSIMWATSNPLHSTYENSR